MDFNEKAIRQIKVSRLRNLLPVGQIGAVDGETAEKAHDLAAKAANDAFQRMPTVIAERTAGVIHDAVIDAVLPVIYCQQDEIKALKDRIASMQGQIKSMGCTIRQSAEWLAEASELLNEYEADWDKDGKNL
jgi:hypothetical protein